jgi:hypothetical protein
LNASRGDAILPRINAPQCSFRVAIRNQDMPIDVSRNQRDRRDGHDDLCLGIHAAKPVNEGEEIGDTSDARMLRNS